MLKQKPALQYSEGRSSNWSGARLINCFAERADGDKRDEFAVIGSPGLTLWANLGSGAIRGAHVVAGVLYVVAGAMLYSVDAGGSETGIGVILGTDRVRMTGNGSELCIAADGTGYVYSGGALSTPLLFDVSDVTYIDGYIVWSVANSEQFFISALDDALSYDAADIASAEGFPDDIVGLINDHRELPLFGQKTTEIYYNSGAADFPLNRMGNAFIERGCFDRDSIVKIDNSVDFVGDDRIVYNLAGYQPQRISTHAIEYFLRDTSYARGFTYSQEGHTFYGLEVEDGTFLFDHSTGTWHQRQSDGMTHWRVGDAVEAYGQTLLLDRANGKIYTADLDVFTENGEVLPVDIYLPTIEGDRSRVTMYAFEVVCETGVGNATATDPQIMLTYSDDGGHLWSNEMWRSLGAVGDYRRRAIWRKLGQFRQRQMRLRITDAARRLVIAYWADIG